MAVLFTMMDGSGSTYTTEDLARDKVAAIGKGIPLIEALQRDADQRAAEEEKKKSDNLKMMLLLGGGGLLLLLLMKKKK